MKFHNELNKIKLKIPKFYINLDKNIFFIIIRIEILKKNNQKIGVVLTLITFYL